MAEMNETFNLTDTRDIGKRLEEINETLSSISAKEVLFIITLSFLAVFAAINMCLLILERRKKRKQNSVPQSIVIQPNNAKSDNKPGRNEKSKMSSGYEKDVLPSKSMKMKVSISPNMSVSKKARAQSKESTTEDSQVSKTEPSQTEKIIKKPVAPAHAPVSAPPLLPLENAASADVTTAVEPASTVSIPIQPPLATTVAAPPNPSFVSAPGVPPRADTSQSNESSMTSYTVPEESSSSIRSKGAIHIPKETTPSTPTATTLSGVSSVGTAPTEAIKSVDVTTAKDVTQVKSPMMTPIRTPDVPSTPTGPPPVLPTNITTPPPNIEKKVITMFPTGCAPNLSRLPRDTDCTQIGGGPSGYGPPPSEKEFQSNRATVPRMTSSGNHGDRLRSRYEACRSGMHELDVLRAKHTLLIQNLRSRLPVIPGSLDDVQTREKKSRDGFLDRFSLQSVDSGISSQNTISSTRSSTPEDFKTSNRHSNIYENSSTTMNYSTFRKMSLESTHNSGMNNSEYMEKTSYSPPVITARSCHRGAWKTAPQRVRPKSMFDSTTSSTEYLFAKPPRHPIDLTKERRSAFTVINQSSKRHSSIEPTNLLTNLSQLSLNEEIKTPQKGEVIRWNKQKSDTMFRANVVYVSSQEQPPKQAPLRFSPARSPPVRRALPIEVKPIEHYAQPCKIRSPKLNSKSVFAAKPIAVRSNASPKVTQRSTWLQSQPL